MSIFQLNNLEGRILNYVDDEVAAVAAGKLDSVLDTTPGGQTFLAFDTSGNQLRFTANGLKTTVSGITDTFAGVFSSISFITTDLANLNTQLASKQNLLNITGADTASTFRLIDSSVNVRSLSVGSNASIALSGSALTIGTVSNPSFSSISLSGADLTTTLGTKQNNLTAVGDVADTTSMRLLNGANVRAIKSGTNMGAITAANDIVTIDGPDLSPYATTSALTTGLSGKQNLLNIGTESPSVFRTVDSEGNARRLAAGSNADISLTDTMLTIGTVSNPVFSAVSVTGVGDVFTALSLKASLVTPSFTGKVRMGVTSESNFPSALDVRGDVMIYGRGGTDNVVSLYISSWIDNAFRPVPSAAIQALDNNYSSHLLLSTAPAGDGLALPVERVRVTTEGLVGINTQNPTSTLHVTGTGNFSGNVVVGGTLAVTGDTTVGGIAAGRRPWVRCFVPATAGTSGTVTLSRQQGVRTATCTKTATGVYRVAFGQNHPAGTSYCAFTTVQTGTVGIVTVGAPAAGQIDVTTYSTAGAAVDTVSFYLQVTQ
jgi:hypothetical protein